MDGDFSAGAWPFIPDDGSSAYAVCDIWENCVGDACSEPENDWAGGDNIPSGDCGSPEDKGLLYGSSSTDVNGLPEGAPVPPVSDVPWCDEVPEDNNCPKRESVVDVPASVKD